MHRFNHRIVSVSAAALGLGIALTAYVRSETPPLAQPLSPHGFLTPRTRAVVSGATAYITGPSEVITEMVEIEKMLPAPDNGAVLVAGYKLRPYRGVGVSYDELEMQKAQRSPEFNLVYWDTRTRTATTLFRESVAAGHQTELEALEWIPQSRTAMMTLRRRSEDSAETTYTIHRVNTTSGTVTRLGEAAFFGVSPTQPLAFTFVPRKKNAIGETIFPRQLRIYTPEGLRNTIRVPDIMTDFNWTRDGKSLYVRKRTTETVDGKEVQHFVYNVLDLATGAVTHPDKLPTAPDTPPNPQDASAWQVKYVPSKSVVTDPAGKAQSVPTLWLRASDAPDAPAKSAAVAAPPLPDFVATESLLLATNATPSTFLRGKDVAAVLFLRDGALCAAPVFRMPVDEFTRSLRQEQRRSTMSNAKQVALGFLQYAADYDDMPPQPGSGVSDAIYPYIKSMDLFNDPVSGEPGFTYAFKTATELGKFPSPADTPLGYISGAGGKAVMWADGRVTWEDAP